VIRLTTIIGARPQFIKAAALSRVIRNEFGGRLEEALVHTGQHHDANMSDIFFEQLNIPKPARNLEISGGNHGAMTGRMLAAIEDVLLEQKPDCVVIYGDTNSTLAAALAAAKLHIPVAHVEAGLRSFNMRMPEEVNRIVADRLSSFLFCPTEAAVANLAAEGMSKNVLNVGDVMYDVALFAAEQSERDSDILSRLRLRPGQFVLATCHRAENTDVRSRLEGIVGALIEVSKDTPVVLPLHPRTRKLAAEYGLGDALARLIITEPLSYLDMVALEKSASVIATDSGGVQKEAFFYRVPCVTMRDETEWVETVAAGWNTLVGADRDKIVAAIRSARRPEGFGAAPYGDGNASRIIAQTLAKEYG
jgi:UDP-GlcNAc3NAcA epimerase